MLQRDEVIKNSHKYKTTNYSTLYKNGKDLFKIFSDYEWQNLEMIEYLNGLYDFVSKNNVLPKELIYYGDVITGYSENFINGFTFEKAVKKFIPFEKKIETINSISLALQDINQHLIVGDINLQNLMVSKDRDDKNGYIIDFDFAKEINNNALSLVFYKIKHNNESLTESLNTDKIKIFISFLSLLYGYNFEKLVSSTKANTLDIILENLENLKNNGLLFQYATYLNSCLNNNLPIEEYFFIPSNYNLENEINVRKKFIKMKNKLF